MHDDETTLSAALLILRRAGVRITGGGLDALSVVLPDRSTTDLVVHVGVAPPPSRIAHYRARTPHSRHLFVMDRNSASAESAMLSGEIDGVVVQPPMVVIGGDVLLRDEASVGNATLRRTGRGRAAWGRWAVDRALILADQPLPQKAIARTTGISQQAVSQALQDHPLVRRDEDGWRAQNRSALIERWLAGYPGPGGAKIYWYSLQPVLQQGHDAVELALELGAEPLLSGDAAADEYAPWRLPSRAILYVRETVDLTPAGFTPAPTFEEATIAATVPADPTIWPVARVFGHKAGHLVDPLIALWDLRNGTGPDADDAAQRLQIAIRDGGVSG